MASGTDRVVRRSAVAIILIVILIVTTTIIAVVSPTARTWMGARLHGPAPGFRVGAESGLRTDLFSGADYTVLVFVTTHCAACQAAQPFHRELARTVDGLTSVDMRVALTSPGDDLAAYATALGVDASVVERVDPRGMPLRRVPTVLIVDRRGIVIEMKEGVLPESEQHALLESLKKLLPL